MMHNRAGLREIVGKASVCGEVYWCAERVVLPLPSGDKTWRDPFGAVSPPDRRGRFGYMFGAGCGCGDCWASWREERRTVGYTFASSDSDVKLKVSRRVGEAVATSWHHHPHILDTPGRYWRPPCERLVWPAPAVDYGRTPTQNQGNQDNSSCASYSVQKCLALVPQAYWMLAWLK